MVQCSGGMGDLFPPQLELWLICELNFTVKWVIQQDLMFGGYLDFLVQRKTIQTELHINDTGYVKNPTGAVAAAYSF